MMNKATKAALLSALIFPGGGHFYLKHKFRGMIFSLFSVGCLYLIVTFAMDVANDISHKLLNGDIPFDINSLMAEVSLQLNGGASASSNIASLLLLGCWGGAIIDSWWLGRKLDEPENAEKIKVN